MADCILERVYIVDNPMAETGLAVGVTMCRVHNWQPVHGDMCPIGRIEKAADEAIAKIEAVASREKPQGWGG